MVERMQRLLLELAIAALATSGAAVAQEAFETQLAASGVEAGSLGAVQAAAAGVRLLLIVISEQGG